MVQTSAVVGVTVEPETGHASGVSARNDTVSPVCRGGDVVVTDAADNVTDWPTAAAAGWSKVIVWGSDPARARNARATPGAGAKVPSPPWVAVTTQKPGAVGVAVEPETVHVAGVSERNDTGSPVPAGGGVVVTDDAVNVTGWPTVVSGGWSKVIVCGRRADPTAGLGIPAKAAAIWACGRPTVGPPTTAARRQNPRNARSQDQLTVEPA